MANSTAGTISFDKYDVTEIVFKLNDNYREEEVNIDVAVNANIETDKSGTKMMVELCLNIFEDAEINGYPFEMKIVVRGTFSSSLNGDISKYKKNALAILYPYARAVVSSYTSTANVTPLILPTVNINSLVDEAEVE